MSIQVTIMSIDFDSFEEPVTRVFHKNEVSVGRKPENDLILDRPEISSFHAKLVVKQNGHGEPRMYVMDMGSSNGTMLERDSIVPAKEIPIEANQRLIIGSYLLKPRFVGEMVEETENSGAIETQPQQGEAYMSTDTVIHRAFPHSEESAAEPLLRRDVDAEAVTHEMPAIDDSSETTVPDALATRFATVVPPVLTVKLQEEALLDLDFVASQLFRVSGQVLHKGKPLAGVHVEGGDLGVSKTGADGRFAFPDIEEGTAYRLSLSLDGYTFEPGVFSGTVEGDASLNVQATKLYRISGKVLHRGRGLAGVEVSGGPLGSRVTGIDGGFSFEDVRDGAVYHIRAEKERFVLDTERSGTVENNIDLSFNARELLRIGGRVVHKGKPLAGVEIECINLGKTTTDDQGNYVFENVPEGGEYTFTASKAGFRLSHTKSAH